MGLRELTLNDFVRHNAIARADAPALLSDEAARSHAAFHARVEGLASGLAARGIEKGDRVCILAENGFEYFELYGACARLGAIACPINWRLSGEEVRAVLSMADPAGVIADGTHVAKLEGTDLGALKARALIGQGEAHGFTPFAQLYATEPAPDRAIRGEDPFVILPTAAVGGVPRGATLTHANLIMAGYQLMTALKLSQGDRHIAALPLFHVTGLGLSLAVLQAGGCNVVLPRFDPLAAVDLMDQHGVTLMASFPPVLSLLLEARAERDAPWSSLRYVLGLDQPEVIQRLLAETEAQFWTGFGQSETSGVVTLVDVEERPGTAGRALPAARVRCVDALGVEVPVGKAGEIAVQGPLVFAGYWADEEATEFAFRHGWHHTGDVGRFDEEGYLQYLGRKPEKELIKSGGENVYPAEVEQVIEELPQVAAVCVIGVEDKEWGEAVKAVIELLPGERLTEEQVAEAVAARIAAYKKPRRVEFVDSLPKDDEGGVDRQAVKARYG